MFRTLLKVIVLSLICHSNVLSQQLIHYNLKVNDTFLFHQQVDQNILQIIDGNQHIIDNSIKNVFSLVVKKSTDSSYFVNFKFEKFSMYAKSNLYGVISNIDTDSINVDDAQSRTFLALTNSTLSFELLKNGKVKNLKGTDALIKKMIDGAGYEDEFTKAVMTEAMGKEFGNQKMTNSLEQFTYFYPKKAVQKGDSWKNKYSGDYNSMNTWFLKSLDKEKINISGTGKVSINSSDEDMEMALNGTSKTELSSNKSNGILIKMVVESVLEGTSTVKSMDSSKLPTTIITKTTYKTLKNVQQNF